MRACWLETWYQTMERITDIKLSQKIILESPIESVLTNYEDYPLEVVHYRSGEHICRYGDSLTHIYFFLTGKAKVYSLLSNGKSYLHTFYNQFEIIGDVEFVNHLSIKTNIQAITEVYCLLLPLNQCHDTLYNDCKFLRAACSHLANKLDITGQLNSHNLLYPLDERLAAYIINSTTNDLFSENLTYLSELLGTSYRHLLRTLKFFCEKGYLKKEKYGYKIIAPSQLSDLGADIYMNY
jgi:CRP-like cAMP-binding protein